jgi:hypothetical protein
MRIFCVFTCIFVSVQVLGQQPRLISNYSDALDSLSMILGSPHEKDFKKAVYFVENAYYDGHLNYSGFDTYFKSCADLISSWVGTNHSHQYKLSDSLDLLKNMGIYTFFTKGIKVILPQHDTIANAIFAYNFDDFSGFRDWSDMFVSKLLLTHKGNCHSLPYLYKILADELGATCWLSLAPNHMYIKNRCKGGGWYNTELTSGTFPVDAWIMTSGYVTVDAVKSGIYMDTLSNQQAIALCVLDLAKEYEHQTKNYYDGFIIKCCDLSLQYFPLNAQAILLKAETLKRVYEKQAITKLPEAKDTYGKMQSLYIKLLDLGYQEMPDKMYQKWLQSIKKEKAKYNSSGVALFSEQSQKQPKQKQP